ncbi:MAG: tetratricopeptide repeat protein, partial [Gemmataceae bacterium]
MTTPIDDLNRAEAALNADDPHEALEVLSRRLAETPSFVSAYRLRAQVHTTLGRVIEAIADWSQAIRLEPEEAQHRAERAALYLRQRQHEECIADCEIIIQHDPARADAYLLRGTARAAHGQSDLALADFAQSIELDPENSETFIARSELYTDLEQPDLAQLDMERALQLLTEMAGATVERAEAAAGLGVAGLLYMQGKQALSNGDYAEAAEHFEAALERAPNELPPRLGRMMTAYLLEDWSTAIDQATVVLEQDAENSSARQVRGLAYAELGEIAAAVADLDAYVAANADVPKPYQLRASVRSKFGL